MTNSFRSSEEKMASLTPREANSDFDFDEFFERYGPLDNVDAFIDSQFAYALGGEEDGGAQVFGSKMEVQNMESGNVATLQSFAFGTETQLNLDSTILLSSPQGHLESHSVCPYCRRSLETEDPEVICGAARPVGDINKIDEDAKADEMMNRRAIHDGVEGTGDPIDPRKSVVTELQLAEISEDVGTCWRQLGPKLDIAAAKIQNLDEEYKFNRDKANALLLIWEQKEGKGAMAGILADALESIGRKSIAEKLLGGSEVNTCVSVVEGHSISLTVRFDFDAELDNKLILCEDAQGNKFMLKALTSSDKFWDTEEILRNKRFLENVAVAAQEMAKTTEQRRQESLKRISSEVQELRQKLKKVKLDCGDGDPNDGCNYCSVDVAQPICDSFEDSAQEKCHLQDESVEQMIQSCVEQRNLCQGIFDALINLVSEVGKPREDSAKCIGQLCDFTKELRDQEKTLFSKIEFVHNQQLDKNQVIRIEQLQKWKRAQKEQVEGVEKLLSNVLQQGSIDRRQSYGKMERQKLLNRRSEPIMSTKTPPGYGRRRAKTDSSKHSGKSQSTNELTEVTKKSNISSPRCVRRMCLMDTDKKSKKEKKENSRVII